MQQENNIVSVCSSLEEIENGEVSPESVLTTSSPIGTVALYSCNDGFFSSVDDLQSRCIRGFYGPSWTLGPGPTCSQGNVISQNQLAFFKVLSHLKIYL